MGTFKCKLGFHDWVTHGWMEYRQRPRKGGRFSHKGGRKKVQYYYHRVEHTYCIRCGKRKKK